VIIMAVHVPVQQLPDGPRRPDGQQPPDRPPPDGQRPPDSRPLPFGQRLAAWLLKNRGMQAFYGTLLLGTVAAALLPAVIFQPHSRIFLLKLAAIALFASMPGLLYVQFVRFKGHNLYDEFVINLFRLRIDRYRNLPAPPRHTSYYCLWRAEHDKLQNPGRDNLYRRKFETVYGEQAVSTRGQFADGEQRPARSEGFYPVVLTTALLCLGWVVVIQPELYHDFNLLGRLPFSGQPQLPFQALQFGFVGAYWFILQDMTRRYFRQDLKTAAYVSASTRLVVVTITVATVALIPMGSPARLDVLAFFIGIFPQIGVQLLKAAMGKLLSGTVPELSSRFPLSDLDGLTVWDQARLLEEGIEDMHALATANLVDLLLGTRVPVGRLVDWVDQALLCLYVPKEAGQRTPRDDLRMAGIRTATDLIRLWDSARPSAPLARQRIAAMLAGDEDSGMAAVEAILASLDGSPNLEHVRAFRSHEWLPRGTSNI
jgi:hypothetical protein